LQFVQIHCIYYPHNNWKIISNDTNIILPKKDVQKKTTYTAAVRAATAVPVSLREAAFFAPGSGPLLFPLLPKPSVGPEVDPDWAGVA
jgi:hypothetical protein